MRTAPHTRRAGFSLIELMVVVALLALLAALVAGGINRVRQGELNRASEATLRKLNTGLDRRWKAVNDQAADEIKGETTDGARFVARYCGNDRDRARAVWTYLKLKNEFPTTRAEAIGAQCPNPTQLATDTRRGIWIWDPQVNTNPAVLVLSARKVFADLPLALGTEQEQYQSAACVYLALTATGNRGETFGSDGTQNQEFEHQFPPAAPTASVRVFKDSWGQPVAFARMGYGTEFNRPPFVAENDLGDPTDPRGTLVKFSGVWTTARLNYVWTEVVARDYSTRFHPAAPFPPLTSYPWSAGPPQVLNNWVPTLISAGPDKTFCPDLGNTQDDILSARLRREGARGD